MIIENGRIVECTDAELFEHWMQHFDEVYSYWAYKDACIRKGTKVTEEKRWKVTGF